MLKDSRWYSAQEVYRQCNAKLGTDYKIQPGNDSLIELTPLDRAALKLAHEAGWLSVEIREESMVIRLPDPEDPEQRISNRRRLAKILKLPVDQWPAEKGLHRPAKIDPSRPSVLLIHGFDGEIRSLQRPTSAFEAAGFQVFSFDYPSHGAIASAGDRLRADLHQLAAEFPELRLAIVAQSLGGLVARSMLETSVPPPRCVTDLVTLGTPHQGTQLAELYSWHEPASRISPAVARPVDLAADGLGEVADDLNPRSRFLKELNSQPRARGVRYHVATGKRGILSPADRERVEKELRRLTESPGRKSTAYERLLRIAASDEFRNGDGVVSLARGELSGATSKRAFDLNHIDLIHFDGDPPQSGEVFRWIVEVLRLQTAKGTEP